MGLANQSSSSEFATSSKISKILSANEGIFIKCNLSTSVIAGSWVGGQYF